MPPFLTEAIKQSPLAMVLIIAVIAFARGSVVPGSAVTAVTNQCIADKTQLTNERDRWQRVALRGSNVLQERAQDLAEIAPSAGSPSARAREVTIQAKPLSPRLKAEIEKPSVVNDPTSVERRIEASDKILQSAPVPTRPKSN